MTPTSFHLIHRQKSGRFRQKCWFSISLPARIYDTLADCLSGTGFFRTSRNLRFSILIAALLSLPWPFAAAAQPNRVGKWMLVNDQRPANSAKGLAYAGLALTLLESVAMGTGKWKKARAVLVICFGLGIICGALVLSVIDSRNKENTASPLSGTPGCKTDTQTHRASLQHIKP